MSEKYERPCFVDETCVLKCFEGEPVSADNGCGFLARRLRPWESCPLGKLFPGYAEYAAQSTGREVIVDVEGLVAQVTRIAQSASRGHLDMGEQVLNAIDAHAITAPDLVRREDAATYVEDPDNLRLVPEWDGKE